MVKLFVRGNYFYKEENGNIEAEHKSNVKVIKLTTTSTAYIVFFRNIPKAPNPIEFADIRDENDTAYTDQATFETFIEDNTGFNPALGGSGAGFARTFSGGTKADAETARDAYYTANPSELRDGLQVAVIATTPDPDEVTVQIYSEGLTAWEDITTVLSPGEIATLLGTIDWQQFSQTEKTKLAGIEDDATGDQTGPEIIGLINAEDDENLVTDVQLSAIGTSLQGASGTGLTLTFTRQNGNTFNVPLTTDANRPLVPEPAGGNFLDLRPSDEDWDASSGAFPSGAEAGYTYIVSAAGTVDSIQFAPHDLLIALVDSPSTTTYDNNWQKVEGGVHSWGGLIGVISDQNIIDKLTRLGFSRTSTYAAPSVHNLSVDIPSRVDLNTDLNVSHNFTFSVTNRQNIQSMQLLVVVGDNKTVTKPTTDGEHTQAIVLSGIDTAGAGPLTFTMRITDTQSNTHDSNVVTIDVRDLSTNENAYYGVLASDTFSSVDLNTLTSVDVTASGTQYNINESGANETLLGILSPANRDPVSILDPLGQESISGFTATLAVRTEGGTVYNLLTLANNSGFTGTFNYNVTTE